MIATGWREIGDRVLVRRYSTWNGEPFDQNVGLVLGATGGVLIDTRASLRLAAELRAELRHVSTAPLAAIVNTHHHWDHAWGNAAFAGAPIWGHVRCAERVASDSQAVRRRLVAEEPSLADELNEVSFLPPDRTFDGDAVLDLGDRQLELRFLGRGHTDNDIAVLVPDAQVVFAGDLLENDAPPSFVDAFPAAWARTARRLAALVSGGVVPGHGSVGDRKFAERQADELGAVARLAARLAAGELDEADALRASPFPTETTRIALARARDEAGAAGLTPGR